ncbi:speckle-type POZ protein-like B [Aphidius gifuensis]|uniref:speckle-type POZ protein-like B n=1 Tax=Aphidius gifuensis TaxID=684658 RepID=UPI001CDD1D91|nr:speckle-type POZ protein-like B [Aphidius gifuensis]
MSVLDGLITHGSMNLVMSKQNYVTGMETCEFTYEWKIKNFSEWNHKIIESPSFSSHFSDFKDNWTLKIYRGTCNILGDDRLYKAVDLQIQSFNNTSHLQTECKMSINNKNEQTRKYDFKKFLQRITWDRYILTSNLLEPNNGYLQNDELKICCTITMSKKRMNNSDVISTFDATQQLSADLKKILLTKQLSDVTIQVGQKSFPAIKGILGARKNQKNEVVIEDIDEDVFEEFLLFIYTDKSPNIEKMPMELLAAAEKYQVDCLKNACEKVICGTINLNNVASLLVISDKYNLEILNENCLEFMKKNLRAVWSNETFKTK